MPFNRGIVAERIKAARSALGVTQAEIAKRMGITQAMVSLYESGRGLPNLRKLYNLSCCFGVSADWLLGMDLSDQPQSPPMEEYGD